MKRILLIVSLICFSVGQIDAQNTDPRIQNLEIKLDSLQTEVPGLFKPMDFSLGQAKLNDFIRAISVANEINVSLDPNLNSTLVSQSFKNATAKNILLNLCKEYSLTIEVFGNILAIKKYNAPYRSREIVITYQKDQDLFSADFKRDSLSIASRKITKVTGKNVMFTLGLEGKRISGYVKDMPFEAAIDKIALTNNLEITKTKDNFYLFAPVSDGIARRRGLARRGNFNYQVKDTVGKILEVDFVDVPIESVINDIAFDLNINMAISEPLKNIGKATIKSDSISFNNLLTGLLENTKYTYKLEEGMYFFGKQKLASVEDVEIVTLMNRSIHAMMEPMQAADNFSSNTQFGNTFSQNGNFNGGLNPQNQNFNPQRRQNQISRNVSNQNNAQGVSDALDNIFPDGIMDSLNIKIDVEQNSFLVKGDALRIEKFKKFVKKIDKPVPLVMIEVMLIEVNKSRSVSAGIEWGIGDAPRSDLGDISSNEGLTIGSKTINRVIGGFDGIGSLNIGRVVPNFYANIQALETNGDLKVRSTPKLSALNGHVASLTNGQRTYFTQTLVNTIGVENPQQQQFVNFIPIDANLSIKIRPIVSGDGNVTLSIDVMQSSFSTGERVAEGAPPDINTSQFNSTIKVRDKDVVILGGLEVDSKSDSGSGIPFLARIPVIKWLFSKRVRTKSESKLSVIIRPTIIQN